MLWHLLLQLRQAYSTERMIEREQEQERERTCTPLLGYKWTERRKKEKKYNRSFLALYSFDWALFRPKCNACTHGIEPIRSTTKLQDSLKINNNDLPWFLMVECINFFAPSLRNGICRFIVSSQMCRWHFNLIVFNWTLHCSILLVSLISHISYWAAFFYPENCGWKHSNTVITWLILNFRCRMFDII